MSLISALYTATLELHLKEQELSELKEEYNAYRRIAEANVQNKRIKDIKDHISWYNKNELKKKAKEIDDEEFLENGLMLAKRQARIRRRQERRREGRRREGRREREEKKRAAERKALDELMEKEMKERRNRKNTGAN